MLMFESIVYTLPSEIIDKIGALTTIFKAVGGLIIFYLILNIINVILNRKKNKELKKINKSLKEIKKILSKKK